ncbi:MAG: hypothetical protein AAF821_13280 [Cyanobacteria bacterium P01_D01_bin.156]
MDNVQENFPKNTRIVAALALLGALQPTPLPLAGIHKFYRGQYGWGILYVLLGFTQVSRIASAAEGIWYLLAPHWQSWAKPSWLPAKEPPAVGETVDAVASGLREIEQLRQEGLLSEHEFEQKRRSLLEKMP